MTLAFHGISINRVKGMAGCFVGWITSTRSLNSSIGIQGMTAHSGNSNTPADTSISLQEQILQLTWHLLIQLCTVRTNAFERLTRA